MPVPYLLCFFVCALLSGIPVAGADDDDNDDDPISGLLTLPLSVQHTMPIETQPAQRLQLKARLSHYGSVLDLTPLLSFRGQCLANKQVMVQAQAQFNISQAALARVQTMYRNKVTSLRALEQQKRQWLADQTALNTATLRYHTLIRKTRLQWRQLADIFCQQHGRVIDLVTGNSKIIAIPRPHQAVMSAVNTLDINISGVQQTITVQPLPNIDVFDVVRQTSQILFITHDEHLHNKQHFNVQLPLAGPAQHGLFIPASAMLWHLGQAFVYIKVDPEHFRHQNIDHYTAVKKGYLVFDNIKPGDEVVVRGGQILLSYEFRSQIPDDD